MAMAYAFPLLLFRKMMALSSKSPLKAITYAFAMFPDL